ncbi:hypothetical protein F0562_021608 [Nyssa sinensis]|uniref:Uncharacterized protein n=1 Tax=Nyssa sinensis TaxID=561372 RepID=A0A5J5BLY9_9ASTE|nr:hypothetical protein F0562_021608 [Nyssa sinensis]
MGKFQSRKSTQKRQKQYFEQRKRQQQQQTTGVESYFDGMNTCSQHQTNNRSLDVLSLLNLSTNVQSSCTSTRENSEVNALTVDYHITKSPPTIQTNKVTRVDPIEFVEARTSSGYQGDTVYPKKALYGDSDNDNRVLNKNDGISNQLNTASQHQLSILDLLIDDGPNGNSEGSPVHEAYVAFSCEGLGKVETQTPVRSPLPPDRNSSYGSSPLKAGRRHYSSKNLNNVLVDLELEVDAMMQDITMPLCSSSLQLPFFSNGIMDTNSFGDLEIFYSTEDKSENIWNATSSFLDVNFLDERDYNISWKNCYAKMDRNSADYWNFGNDDFTFEDPYLRKKRATGKAMDRFNILESPAPYYKHQTSENDHDFITPNGTTCYPTLGRNCDIGGVPNQPAWSCFVKEDSRETLSLLSEESCSSSAVRGEATKKSSSNSMARQNMRRNGSNHRNPVNNCDMKNMHAKQTCYNQRDNFQRGDNVNGQGEVTRMSNPASSKPAHYINITFQKKFEPEDSCLFEGRYTSIDINSGFSSLCGNSGAEMHASSNCKLWTEDPFGACPVPDSHANARSSFERSKHDIPAECSPFLEKLAFCQQLSHVNSHVTPIFSNTGSQQTKPNLSPDSNMKGRPQESFHIAGSRGDDEFPNISVRESVRKEEENKWKNQPTDPGNFELQEDICYESNGLSSENGKSMYASDSEGHCSDFKEAKDKTEEMESLKATCSPEYAEEMSSSVKIPDKSENSFDEKEYQTDAQTSPCQNECKGNFSPLFFGLSS